MRREYTGAARKARLAAPLGGSPTDLGILGDDLTGWPVGTDPFFIVIDRGQATEEKILCSLRSANSLTVYTDGAINGRGADGTAIVAHGVGATLEHIWTATDADEANEHVNNVQNVHGVTSPVVGRNDTQTLTNKTMSGTANTFTDIPQAAVDGLVAKHAALDATDADLQAQINAKAPSASPTFTGTVSLPSTTSIGPVSATEIGYVDGATSNIQAQLNAKAPLDSPLFTGTPVLPGTTLIGGLTIGEITSGSPAIIPPGGDTGWLLGKKSATDYDLEWIDPATISGGTGGGIDYDPIVPLPYPTGGTVTTYTATGDGDGTAGAEYRVHTFSYAGIGIPQSFVVSGITFWGRLLIIAGGGTGGTNHWTGIGQAKGGAGALFENVYNFGTGTHNTWVGNGATSVPGPGGDTRFDDVIVKGGGYGGGIGFGDGGPGGCGGGGYDTIGGGAALGGSLNAGTSYTTDPVLGFHCSAGAAQTGGGAGGLGVAYTSKITGAAVAYGHPGNGVNGRGDGGANGGGAGGHGVAIVRYRIA